MREFLLAGAFALLAAPAIAQDSPPPYDNGPVWVWTGIKTHDGHFDDYMKFLATDFKAENEALKKEGVLLDYKVFIVSDPRAEEPDVWLAREYPNMATFDRSPADDFALQKKVLGSVTISESNQKQAARGSIRDIKDQEMMREITLK